jgi:hypothetical protein
MSIVMSRHPLRIAIAATLYTVGVGWVVDTNPWSGPTLVRFSETHGLHSNDWVTLALWAAAVATMCPALSPVSRLRNAQAVESAD